MNLSSGLQRLKQQQAEIEKEKIRILLELRKREQEQQQRLQSLSLDELRQLADTDKDAERILCERSFIDFFRRAWRYIDPSEYIHGWHIEAIATHLEAVSAGKIRRLIINIPPRCAKSLLVSVAWPAWDWTSNPHRRFLSASYAQVLSVRDNVKCRRLIDSDWYQGLWSDKFQLAGDQNAKGRFENNKGGYRIATSVDGALTGDGGDIILADDPHNVREAESKTVREGTLEWWDTAMSTRLNDPSTGAYVVIMQRVHEEDLSGHLLAKGGWEHLCLPAMYESKRKCITSIGWQDPRKEDNELLWPERLPETILSELEQQLGSRAYAGQFQQRPAPAGGGIFKRHWWRYYDELPSAPELILQAWDTAFKTGEENDYSACTTWAVCNRMIYLLDWWQDKLEFPELKQAVRNLAERHQPRAILIEDKASGQSLIQELRRLHTVPIIPIKVDNDKEARAHACTPLIEAGNVYLPKDNSKIADFIDTLAHFPGAAHDDLVDSTTMALNYLSKYTQRRELRFY